MAKRSYRQTLPPDKPALRIPPYSAEAETAVIGSIMLDPHRTLDLCSEMGIVSDSFWIAGNRTIFEICSQLFSEGKPVDVLSVCDGLRSAGELDSIGGTMAVERIVEGTPAVAHAEYYASILRDKHLLRQLIDMTNAVQEKCFSPDRTVELIISETEQDVLAIGERRQTAIIPWAEAITDTFGKIDKTLQRKDGISGISTGFKNLDDKLSGLRDAEMIVLAARPSMGKTSLAMNICENIALGTDAGGKVNRREPLPVGIFSCEMSVDALITRMLCSRARVSLQSVMAGYVNKVEANTKLSRAASELMKAPIYVDDTGGLDIMDLRARARRMKKRYGIRFLMIDYLQLLNSREYFNQGRQLETSHISANIKAMAKELEIPVLVLSQLSRAPETRDKSGKPRISDLRDSGAIEQDADVVMLLWRPIYYADKFAGKELEDETLAKIDIGKNRNGAQGVADLTFESEFTQFTDRAYFDEPLEEDD
jgi:replicative DNA helicase